MARIKICGLTCERDVEFADVAKPDLVGFIIDYPVSRRSLSLEEAARLNAMTDIRGVAVLVDPSESFAQEAAAAGFDFIQLHGGEDAEFITRVKQKTGVGMIKAFVYGEQNFAPHVINSCPADYVLIDGGRGGGRRAGEGATTGIERRFFYAGGLDPGNIASVVRELAPFAVDVSTGVETDGKKDLTKMIRAVTAAHEEAL